MSGAAREYLPMDGWRERVEQLAQAARFIVVLLGTTKGLAWEVQRLMETGCIEKTMFLIPNVSDEEAFDRCRSLLDLLDGQHAWQLYAGLRRPGIIGVLFRDGTPVLVTAPDRSEVDYQLIVDLAGKYFAHAATQPRWPALSHASAQPN